MGVWLQGALEAMDTGYGRRGNGHPGWYGGLLSGWLPALHSRSLVLVSSIYKGSATLTLHFLLLRNVLLFRP